MNTPKPNKTAKVKVSTKAGKSIVARPECSKNKQKAGNPPKHSKAADKAHPAPVRSKFKTAKAYAEACRLVNGARIAFDAPKLTTAQKLDAIGIDAICERIVDGEFQAEIARSLGVAKSHFTEWLAADPERSARARESRVVSAQHWDSEAERVLKNANETSAGAISKARELASHYRWRASKRAPKEYGDKLDLNHSGQIELTDVQIATRLSILIGKTGVAQKIGNSSSD